MTDIEREIESGILRRDRIILEENKLKQEIEALNERRKREQER